MSARLRPTWTPLKRGAHMKGVTFIMVSFETAKKTFDEKRPKQFLENPMHCDECEEVERNAASNDLESVTADIASGGYASFLSFLSDEAYCYYFPAFVRICLESKGDEENEFLPDFMFSLTYEGNENDRLKYFSDDQKRYVYELLEYIECEMKHEVWLWLVSEDLQEAKRIWKM